MVLYSPSVSSEVTNGNTLHHYENWIRLPFRKIQRLVIDGPTWAVHSKELSLNGVDGLRFGIMLSKVNYTVKILILRVSLLRIVVLNSLLM